MTKMIEASTRLCRNNDKIVANKRMRIIGLLNWSIRSVIASDLFCGFMRLAPLLMSLFFASPVVRPLAVALSLLNKSIAEMLQKDCRFCSMSCFYLI
jgi:hypothetical protein